MAEPVAGVFVVGALSVGVTGSVAGAAGALGALDVVASGTGAGNVSGEPLPDSSPHAVAPTSTAISTAAAVLLMGPP